MTTGKKTAVIPRSTILSPALGHLFNEKHLSSICRRPSGKRSLLSFSGYPADSAANPFDGISRPDHTFYHRRRILLHFRQHKNLSDRIAGAKAVLISIFVFTAVFLVRHPARGAMDLADEPLLTQIKPAPANIMILLDDSASMTFEILTTGYYEGRFPGPGGDGSDGYGYIFDCPQDEVRPDGAQCMAAEDRKIWKSQSHEYNLMYYDPAVAYTPWPGYANRIFQPADIEFPKYHPLDKNGDTLDLDDESFVVTLEIQALPVAALPVKNAHYFQVAENGKIYLIVLDGDEQKINYFEITQIEGSGMAEKVRRAKAVTVPPAEIRVKDYDKARQNFANWFTYHRRREYVAKAAAAEMIANLKGVRIGILSINGNIIIPLNPIGVWRNGILYDDTATLLQALYACDSAGDTPLRESLHDVGEYYRRNSKRLTHHGGKSIEGTDPPYYPEADGGACQQSFTIIMTDGYYSYENMDLKVGNADGDNNSLYDGGRYSDSLSETLADVAMYFYENDLSPDPEDTPAGDGLPDRLFDPQRVSECSPDHAHHQHMVTFGVALRFAGNLDPDNYKAEWSCVNHLSKPDKEMRESGDSPKWPEHIAAGSKETIDDLFHAAANGRGRFLAANHSTALPEALTGLTRNVMNRLDASSSILISRDARYGPIGNDILMLQASYSTADWSGDVRVYRVDPASGAISDGHPAWSAADNLNLKSWDQRNILSFNANCGIEFDENQLTEAQKKNLGPHFRDLVHFIRGRNIDGYRIRATKLGDIVHSSPVAEGGIVYVGANDGMLHAFELTADDEGTTINGDEIFAYIPNCIFENLKELADPGYRHKYFVDLTPTVVKGDGVLGGENPQTILVGGLGKGGKGYFALDITTPESMTAQNVLWEFPMVADREVENDIGYSFGKPLVVRTNSARNDEFWIVVLANGYDSANGKAVLFILHPKTGEIIKKIVADNPSIGPGNGLSSPIAVDVNSDSKVDFIYAGDLKGNLWKFDLTADDASQWTVAYSDGAYDQPLFTAVGPDGSKQPITTRPEVMLHPDGQGLMVLFGTGKLLGNSDLTDNSTQTVYGVWDYGDRIYSPGKWGDYSRDDDREYLGTFTRAQLSNQPENVTLMEQTSKPYTVFTAHRDATPVKVDLRVMSDGRPSWKTSHDNDGTDGLNFPDLADSGTCHAGWFYDLPLDGERIISDVMLRDGRLTVICFTPGRDRCRIGGSSFLMELNAFTGGSIPAPVWDINEDGVIDRQDTVVTGYEGEHTTIGIPPAGIKMPGNLQPPAVLRLNDKVKMNFLISSAGTLHLLKEQAERLGVIYWKELEQ